MRAFAVAALLVAVVVPTDADGETQELYVAWVPSEVASALPLDVIPELNLQLVDRAGKQQLELHARWIRPVGPIRPAGSAEWSDPLRGEQYALDQINISPIRGLVRSSVTVAVLDSGVQRSHEDLRTARIVGSAEGSLDSVLEDPCGHGTLITGIAAAAIGNGLGIEGTSESATILPIRVLHPLTCQGTTFDLAAAIVRATNSGAGIISLSISAGPAGGISPPELTLAIDYATQRGVVVVAAAGNTHGGRVTPPADDSRVIAVGCVDARKAPCPYGAHEERIRIFAPGDAVVTTHRMGGYAQASGTSMSTPHVSAAIADVMSMTALNASEAAALVIGRASPNSSGFPVLDVGRAALG